MFSLHHDYSNERTKVSSVANTSIENMTLLQSFGANLDHIK